ncbi:MAG TPA: hypothetical protein VNW06_05430, partial [Cytophagaceae bacterium]|nr:hypothetical protein [Cytophagaceae bacterium]
LEKEDIQILIDGKPNELTKTIGQEIFINDFILPKEIAKFFFFDAEKITALAEINSLDEKQYFSKAYNEVLGIKQYIDLKQNLENLLLRIKKRSAVKGDLQKIDSLQKKLTENLELLSIFKQELSRKEQDQMIKKSDFSETQEQLVRLGSILSPSELLDFKKMRSQLKEEMAKNKGRFNEMLELAPFAMLSQKMLGVHAQLKSEETQQHIYLVNTVLEEKYLNIKNAFENQENIDFEVVKSILEKFLLSEKMTDRKTLFDFTVEQRNQFRAVLDNLNNAYSKSFKQLVANAKRLQSTYNILQKKVQDAELKENDPVIKVLRQRFETINQEIQDLDNKILQLKVKTTVLEKDIAAINRQLSEQSKNIKVEEIDRQKADATVRLLNKLESFISQLKQTKKVSLQKGIKSELNRLMHKSDFVKEVNVHIDGDLIDIDLLDLQGQKINKVSLSKGEQQLYATALLKALVGESNIQFPVFIDSPLQKLDKLHAANIIKDFYPVIAGQVVLFPLLEKELTETEYQLLLPKVGKAYIIQQFASYRSGFNEVHPKDLFSIYQNMPSSHV